jgi:hypothetical protein
MAAVTETELKCTLEGTEWGPEATNTFLAQLHRSITLQKGVLPLVWVYPPACLRDEDEDCMMWRREWKSYGAHK